MSHQDWTDVSWDKRASKGKGESKTDMVNRALRGNGATVVTEKKHGAGGNAAGHSAAGAGVDARKLEADDDIVKLAAPSMELRKMVQSERLKAKLSQAELAQLCNVKPAIIGDYEAGRGVPNPAMIQRIERALRSKNPELAFGALTKAQKRG